MNRFLRSILFGYSYLFLANNLWFGLGVASLLLINPNLAISGAFAVGCVVALVVLFGGPEPSLTPLIFLNPLLVGLAIGDHYQFDGVSALLIVFGAALSVGLTVVLDCANPSRLRFPILSLPFVITSSIIYLAAGRFSNLFLAPPPAYLSALDGSMFDSMWATEFFKAVGSIIFLPHVIVGVILFGLLVVYSRLLAGLSLWGFTVGVIIQGYFSGNMMASIHNSTNFNFCLIAMAIGGIFLRPSPRSLGLATLGVGVSTVLTASVQTFWAQYGIPAFTLPFITVSGMACVIAAVGTLPEYWNGPFLSPEHSVDIIKTFALRLKHGIIDPGHGELFVAPIWFSNGVFRYRHSATNAMYTVTCTIHSPHSITLSTPDGHIHYCVDGGWLAATELVGDDRLLTSLFQCCPKAVITPRMGMTWSDSLPAGAAINRIARWMQQECHWLLPSRFVASFGQFRQDSNHTITGIITQRFSQSITTNVQFEAGIGIHFIQSGDHIFERLNGEKE